MKLRFKLILGIVGPISIAGTLLTAAAQPAYPTYPNAPALPSYAATGPAATSSSNAVLVALNAQSMLLTELITKHQKRAEELTQKNQGEKAKWETDLANELQQHNVALQKSIDQATRPTAERKAGAEVDDQLAFFSLVDANLERVGRELSAAFEDSRVLSAQISTNKSTEDFAGMSWALGENQRLVRDLQREQVDLELRRLEFRAIRKAVGK